MKVVHDGCRTGGYDVVPGGADAYGTRESVINDDGRRRTFQCVRYPRDTWQVAVAAFLHTRISPCLAEIWA